MTQLCGDGEDFPFSSQPWPVHTLGLCVNLALGKVLHPPHLGAAGNNLNLGSTPYSAERPACRWSTSYYHLAVLMQLVLAKLNSLCCVDV